MRTERPCSAHRATSFGSPRSWTSRSRWGSRSISSTTTGGARNGTSGLARSGSRSSNTRSTRSRVSSRRSSRGASAAKTRNGAIASAKRMTKTMGARNQSRTRTPPPRGLRLASGPSTRPRGLRARVLAAMATEKVAAHVAVLRCRALPSSFWFGTLRPSTRGAWCRCRECRAWPPSSSAI
eukprot:Amastigsp_a342453_39.p3 type:complete len:181 gc:universal Amastigsp_a342453_39:117-659(+)